MNAMNAARDRALHALNAAKALREQYNGQIPADVKPQFDAHMADWTQAHQEYEACKAQQEQFAQLDRGLELYTTPVAPALHVPSRQPVRQTVEQLAQAKANHLNAFKRFMVGGAQALQVQEAAAYMAGSQALFGNDPREALASLLPAEQFALVGNVDSLGGFLVPEDFMGELIKDLAGFARIRPLCRVKQTKSNVATFMTVASGTDPYSSGVGGSFRAEGWVTGGAALPVQNQPRFGRERVPVHIWAPDVIELTQELIADSAVNLDSEIRGLLAEVRALDEDSTFVLGTGNGMPMGLMTEVALGNIASVNSGAASTLTYTGLVNLFVTLPEQYRGRATWLLNSLTLGALMTLADGEDRPLFPVNTIPTQLFNRPIVVSEWMPNVGASAEPILFGDFSYYAIADRMDMRIIRLVERFAPNVGILAVARVGGQVLKTGAFRAQTIAS